MSEKRVTEEMLSTIKRILFDYKPLIRWICKNEQIDTAKFVDEIEDSSGFSEISLWFISRFCDDIDKIFEFSRYEKAVAFYVYILKKISFEAEFNNKMNYLKNVHDDISSLKCSTFLPPYDEKVIEEIYELSKNVAEADAESNLEKIANLITDIERTGVDMIPLGRCSWIRDKVYLMKASQNVYLRIKKEMDAYPGINDFQYVEFGSGGLYVVEADDILASQLAWKDIARKLFEDEET